jgi:hypothetical protein
VSTTGEWSQHLRVVERKMQTERGKAHECLIVARLCQWMPAATAATSKTEQA